MDLIILALLGVAGILVLAEMLWREELMRRSRVRVLVHILVACWVAAWPYFLDTYIIIGLAVLMLFGVILSRVVRIFDAMHQANRWTIGEYLYPIAIAISAYLAPNDIIFSAAVLQLGLADGLASLVGEKLQFKPYRVLGQSKSVGGSVSFLAVSWFITLLALLQIATFGIGFVAVLIMIPLLSMIAENISVFGLDDLTVPMISLVLLSSLL